MHDTAPGSSDWTELLNPLKLAGSATEYAIDAWQRTLLYADVRRRRGNQYREHLQEQVPNVLNFAFEPVMSGRDLPRPVNYWLVRILPAPEVAIDPAKRPFVVVDPRAGHGPGIGGFKPDSEIGAARAAGHPCYFVGFLPDPVPGQTIEDVMRAEAEFVRKVAELHPESEGKPAVIGNCQAGWQILMTAAVWPDLFGPIIVAGAPLSYWAGDNPMRYAGGLTGGSWATALTSDLGDGRFDGAWLVQNFERLDPANTLWSKQYNLYAKVDTEAERYLGFEKYWGGYVFLEGGEMQYIVDNLFIGNKLATAELVTSDGVRIDLRNIRSPIVVFCSYGDNITPPAQALGWITDLYRNDEDVIGHDQTIVFATHDSIGHLGIFVSASVGRKEHRKFANNIEMIDMLPAGIYRAEVADRPENAADPARPGDGYLMTVRRSGVEEVRDIVKPDPAAERRFNAAARVSEINLALYRNLLQPWVQALSTPLSARWLQALHPLRVGYEWWSDEHPLAPLFAELAEAARQQRRPVEDDNPFLQWQRQASQSIEQALDRYRDHRDEIYALAFDLGYGSPWAQAVAGQSTADTTPPRPHPGDSPEHRAFIARTQASLHAGMTEGGLAEAGLRALSFVFAGRGEVDERQFRCAYDLTLARAGRKPDRDSVRRLLRTQATLMRQDRDAAMAALPQLLARAPADRIAAAAGTIAEVAASGDALNAREKRHLQQVLDIFETARRAAARRPASAPAKRRASTPARRRPPAAGARSKR